MATEYKLSYTASQVDTLLGKVNNISASTSELNYTKGVKSNIQGQIDSIVLENGNIKDQIDAITPENIGAATLEELDVLSDKIDNISIDDIGAAPSYAYGTEDLTAGTSALETGKLYFVYE